MVQENETNAVAAPHDLGISLVPALLRRLAEVHPDVHVDVRLGTSDAVQMSITEGTANLALFNDVGPSAVPARDLFSEPLKWLVLDGGRAVEQEPLPHIRAADDGTELAKVVIDLMRLPVAAGREG
ncbi:LysR substrate-binding domain-containing protein [Pseudodonghicola flavimaris]|uniref:LysR substrate-binding domain-containing protein n=1 Tax=Pseudodonghicola flavimaris TaxID=3050036 RepID=A0ABT7F5C0_9RHOB|nr:LysR substrate-binding domain-containing protein [Pseudodonghicola flavimaris]MDK3019800.1 LysR substrate-binding domain-containing protein [Pseudodonghicola flavimaris]